MAQPGKPDLTPSPVTVMSREVVREEEDPILDASFLLDGARFDGRKGQTPLDLVLAQQEIRITEEMMNGSRKAVRTLVERGLVSHIVLNWVREMQFAADESQQWVAWVERMAREGKHLRASMAVRFGEYRRQLAKTQHELGTAIIEEVRKSAMDKPSKALVRSFLPRGVNPLKEAIENGQNPLVNGPEPSGVELACAFHPSEADPDTNFSTLKKADLDL